MNKKDFNKPNKNIELVDYLLGTCLMMIASVCIGVCMLAYM